METISWNSILSHPSEFVRIDEQLRLLQFEIFDYKDQFLTDSVLHEIYNHEKLIFAFRDAIRIFGRHIFGANVISDDEVRNSKGFFPPKDETRSSGPNFFMDFNSNSMTSEMFRALIGSIVCRRNTEKVFKKFLIEIFDNFFNVNPEDHSFPLISIDSESEKEIIMHQLIKIVNN